MDKKKVPLAEIPKEGSVSEEYFLRMMSPRAAVIAKPFLQEEEEALREVINNIKNPKEYNFLAIGAGQLEHLRFALDKMKNYTCVEPLVDLYIGKEIQHEITKNKEIKLVKKTFQETEKSDFVDGKNLFVFLFNLISYIEHPIHAINNVLKPGDILFFTTWSQSHEAKERRKKYFNYLNSFETEVVIDPENTVGLCNLNVFPYDHLKHYKKHFLIHGTIIDALVIYT